jgi:Trk-type K+ transport system membrane component
VGCLIIITGVSDGSLMVLMVLMVLVWLGVVGLVSCFYFLFLFLVSCFIVFFGF